MRSDHAHGRALRATNTHAHAAAQTIETLTKERAAAEEQIRELRHELESATDRARTSHELYLAAEQRAREAEAPGRIYEQSDDLVEPSAAAILDAIMTRVLARLDAKATGAIMGETPKGDDRDQDASGEA